MSWVFATVFQLLLQLKPCMSSAKVLVVCCLLEATSAARRYSDQTALFDFY